MSSEQPQHPGVPSKDEAKRLADDPPAGCPQNPQRRGFFMKLTLALSGVIGALITLPVLGFVLAPIFRTPAKQWRKVGKLELFEQNATRLVRYQDPSPEIWAGVTAESGAWVRRESETEFTVFSINCRHLGCPVRWIDGAGLFMCPCHGGVYYSDGTVAGGPPPEPLHRMHWRIVDGELEIETGPIPLTRFDKSLT